LFAILPGVKRLGPEPRRRRGKALKRAGKKEETEEETEEDILFRAHTGGFTPGYDLRALSGRKATTATAEETASPSSAGGFNGNGNSREATFKREPL
jgi:hypothetical protein